MRKGVHVNAANVRGHKQKKDPNADGRQTRKHAEHKVTLKAN